MIALWSCQVWWNWVHAPLMKLYQLRPVRLLYARKNTIVLLWNITYFLTNSAAPTIPLEPEHLTLSQIKAVSTSSGSVATRFKELDCFIARIKSNHHYVSARPTARRPGASCRTRCGWRTDSTTAGWASRDRPRGLTAGVTSHTRQQYHLQQQQWRLHMVGKGKGDNAPCSKPVPSGPCNIRYAYVFFINRLCHALLKTIEHAKTNTRKK